MPKYLFEASYTSEGIKGLLKEGGSSRRAKVEEMIRGLGGKLEAFYYALGEPDAYTIADLPDAATAAAVSLRVNASGAVQKASRRRFSSRWPRASSSVLQPLRSLFCVSSLPSTLSLVILVSSRNPQKGAIIS